MAFFNKKIKITHLWDVSILQFAKAGLILVLQQGLGHIWGTIGSVLTPGSILDRRRSGFPDPDPENPEKPEIRKKVM